MGFPRRETRNSKPAPPEHTSAEAAYLKNLGEKQTPVTIKLKDGETVEGWIEYYDRDMLRLTRQHFGLGLSEGEFPGERMMGKPRESSGERLARILTRGDRGQLCVRMP